MSTKLPVMLMVALKAGASSPERRKNKCQRNNSFAILSNKMETFQCLNINHFVEYEITPKILFKTLISRTN